LQNRLPFEQKIESKERKKERKTGTEMIKLRKTGFNDEGHCNITQLFYLDKKLT